MSEKQTNTPEQPSTTQPDNFEDIISIQNNQEREAAQRILKAESSPDKSEATAWDFLPDSRPRSGNKTRNRFIATGVGFVLAVGAGVVATNSPSNQPPTFSEETTTFTANTGDGVCDAAEAVRGSDSADMQAIVAHISTENIDVLKDGLNPGEQLIIPVSVNEKK